MCVKSTRTGLTPRALFGGRQGRNTNQRKYPVTLILQTLLFFGAMALLVILLGVLSWIFLMLRRWLKTSFQPNSGNSFKSDCEHCGHTLECPLSWIGQEVCCPNCSRWSKLPSPKELNQRDESLSDGVASSFGFGLTLVMLLLHILIILGVVSVGFALLRWLWKLVM